jgi:uncharacterized 2Fe-2S/4Fe-4S cluster protein (DUF4445 family)
MPTIVFEPTGRRIKVAAGENLLEVCWSHGIPIESLCGGNGACGKCAVQIIDHDFPVSAEDRKHFSDERLAQGWRLACRARVEHDLRVSVPLPPGLLPGQVMTAHEATDMVPAPKVRKYFLELEPATLDKPASDADLVLRAIPGGDSLRFRPAALRKLPGVLRKAGYQVTVTVWDGAVLDIEPRDTTRHNYGIAFDVGTSTVAALLVHLDTGEELGVAAALNPQRKYGEDVISRISFCRERPEGVETLEREIAGTLSELAAQVTAARGTDLRHVNEYVAVGNTTMMHLLAGVDPSPIGELPYAPVFTACQTLLDGPKGARLGHRPLEIPAALSAFVGSDVLGGLVALGLHRRPGRRLFLDIGTNAELLVGGPERMLAASTAAGPAFEGVKIECGMIGLAGAIESCTLADGDLAFSVIGDVAPAGICGSGLVDIAAVLLDLGIIDASGRLLARGECPASVPPKVRERLHAANGTTRIALAGDVYLSQRDVRELQNAKAAIAAGIEILLRHLALQPKDLDEVLIAGAFGSTVNPRSAQRIGVIPAVPLARVRAVGNTALQGAKAYLLSTRVRAEVCGAGEHIELHELSAEPDFMDRFAANMAFPT